jgi:hypothetical protein
VRWNLTLARCAKVENENARTDQPPGGTRFSTLFSVAAIGGKSPRELSIVGENYDRPGGKSRGALDAYFVMRFAPFAWIALLSAVACRDAPSTSIVVVPRATNLSAEETRQTQGFDYSPTDLALGWRGSDSLIIAHIEAYASHDVRTSTCTGSGIFAIPFTDGGAARAMRLGAPVCEALRGSSEPAALEPNAGGIIYSRRAATNSSQLLRLRLTESTPREVSVGCSPYAEEAAISREGSRLAIRGMCDGRGQTEWAVYVTTIDGQNRRRVIGGDSMSVVMPAWSPDGKSLVVRLGDPAASSKTQLLAIVDVASGSLRPLVAGSFPRWSPDGQWIAFVHTDSVSRYDAEIRIIRPDGSGMRTVYRNRTQTTFVRGWGPMREGMVRPPLLWRPDSRGVVFGRIFDRGTSLWDIALDSADARQVTESAQR